MKQLGRSFPQKIGVLNDKTINLLGLNRSEADILMSADKLKYIEKHKSEFKEHADFNLHVSLIPEIIENPDYVAVHPSGESVEYIKTVNETVLVAVRLKQKDKLWFKTMFKLTPAKLQTYLDSGTAKKYT